jgi:hypothetical protein
MLLSRTIQISRVRNRFVGIEVFTTVAMKDVFFYPEDGGDMFLPNVGSLPTYTMPHPRRLHSSEMILFEQ